MVPGNLCCRKLFLLCFSVLYLGAAPAWATVEKLLIVPDHPVTGGRAIPLTLLVMNNSADRQEHRIEQNIQVYLEYGLYSQVGQLRLSGQEQAGSLILDPGSFRKIEYFLLLPADIRPGPLKIIPAEGDGNSPFLMVGVAKTGQQEIQKAEDADQEPEGKSRGDREQDDKEDEYIVLGPKDIEDLQEEKGLYFDNLSPYEPSYFLLGGDSFNAKFQISFKYRLFGADRNEAPVNRSWIEGLHFSYTQLNFWDLAAASKPFADTNFKPEFFYLWEDVGDGFLSEDTRLDLQFGFLHESNGRGGEESRSINTLYVRPAVTFEFDNGYSLELEAGVHTYVGDLSDNPDIIDYRGHTNFVARFGKLDDFQIAAALRGNFQTGRGFLSLDFTYPLNKLFINHPDLYFQAQLVTGYGEKMLSYNREETRVRFGIGIAR